MRRSRSMKAAACGCILTAWALVAALDSQARQSNVYTLNVGSFLGPAFPCENAYRLEKEWGIGASTNGVGLRQPALRQWGGGEEFDAKGKQTAGHKVYTEVALGSHSFNIKLPLLQSAMVLGMSLLLKGWMVLTGALWIIHRRSARNPNPEPDSIKSLPI